LRVLITWVCELGSDLRRRPGVFSFEVKIRLNSLVNLSYTWDCWVTSAVGLCCYRPLAFCVNGLSRGVRDPEAKSVGNFLKRVDPETKLVYGAGKCPKNTKNYQASNLPMNRKGLVDRAFRIFFFFMLWIVLFI